MNCIGYSCDDESKEEKMSEEKVEKAQEKEPSKASQQEDAVLKTTIHFFAEEMLPYFNIQGKVKGIAPTELVYLELKKLYQDFNLEMEDGTWKHFEFQSTNGGMADLKRFRAYEAVASHQYNVAVTTYVLFSGKIKNPMTEYTEGINTYRVVPIIMRDKNADQELKRLIEKVQKGEPFTRDDLILLSMCPLMAGEMDQKERIKTAFSIVQKVRGSGEEIRKIEAVIYAMAEKFLDSMELDEIKEEIKMTRLGQMLVNEGISQGISQGLSQGIGALIEYAQEFGQSFDAVKMKIIEKFSITAEEADDYMEKYWK